MRVAIDRIGQPRRHLVLARRLARDLCRLGEVLAVEQGVVQRLDEEARRTVDHRPQGTDEDAGPCPEKGFRKPPHTRELEARPTGLAGVQGDERPIAVAAFQYPGLLDGRGFQDLAYLPATLPTFPKHQRRVRDLGVRGDAVPDEVEQVESARLLEESLHLALAGLDRLGLELFL